MNYTWIKLDNGKMILVKGLWLMVYDTKMRLFLPSHWLLKLKAYMLVVYMQNYIDVNHQVAVQTNPTHLCTVASADHIYS